MDIVLRYIKEAESYLDLYNENSLDITFEASASEKIDIAKNNNDVSEKSVSSMKKAIAKIREMIKALLNGVRDFVDKLFMSSQEKEIFKKFEELMKSNPEYGNQKITVNDFRKMNNVYDQAIKMAEDAMKKEKDPTFSDEIKEFIKKALPGVVTTIGIWGAVKLAQSNKNMGKVMSSQLKNLDGVMAKVEKNVGEKATKDFKKEIKKAGNDTFWARTIAWIQGEKLKSNKSNSMSITKAIFTLIRKNPSQSDKGAAIAKVGETLEKHPKVMGAGMKAYGKATKTAGDIKEFFVKGK